MDRLSYRTHSGLLTQARTNNPEPMRSRLATIALSGYKSRKRRRVYATLREAGITALEWFLAALLCAGGTYVTLYLISEYACTFRGVC
jgi:hypothetical protein